MALTLITGSANSGKTGVAYSFIDGAAREGRTVALLLPTPEDVARARREFAERQPVGVGIERLSAYLGQVWGLLGDGRGLTDRIQRRALVEVATKSVGLRRLAASAARPSFAATFEPVFARLSEYPRSRLRADEPLDAELLELFDAYSRIAGESGLVDPGAAVRALEQERVPEDLVVVHRFTDLSAGQEALFCAWARAVDVVLTLPFEEGRAATGALKPLVDRLMEAGARRVHAPAAGDPGVPDELVRIERRLFERADPEAGSGAAVFLEAAGEEAEVALVADRVQGLLEGSTGLAPLAADRIAVVFRDPRRRLRGLRQAFASRGIAADFDVNVPLAETPLGRAVLQLLGFSEGERRRDLLAGWLHGPFNDADRAAVDRLDAAWRRSGVRERKALTEDARRLGGETARLLGLAERLSAGRLRSEDLGDWKRLLDTMLACAAPGLAGASGRGAAEVADAHGRILQHLSALADLGERAPEARELASLLRDARGSMRRRDPRGLVTVTEAHRLRSTRFDAVVVGGLTSDEFSSQDRTSLVSDVTSRLTGVSGPSDQALERLLFYQVVTRARRRLELVRLATDSQGADKRPSIFWEEMLDLYRRPDPDGAGLHGEGALAIRKLSLASLETAAPMVSGDRRMARAYARAGSGPSYPPTRHVLADEELLAELSSREEFSVTELETYLRCPYGWFIDRAVGSRELDADVDPRLGGTVVHEALRRTYEAIEDVTGSARVTFETLPVAQGLFEGVFDAVVAERHIMATSLADEDMMGKARRMGLDSLRRDTSRFADCAPVAVEVGFGRGLGPEISLGGVRLRGRIDRVDQGPAGVVVIDYKWSAGPPKARFEADRVLQLPLYAAVARIVFGAPVVAGVYVGLGEGTSRGWWIGEGRDAHGDLVKTDAVDAEEAVAIEQRAIESAAAAAAGIRAGRIEPGDPLPGACTYCSAASFCPRSVA